MKADLGKQTRIDTLVLGVIEEGEIDLGLT